MASCQRHNPSVFAIALVWAALVGSCSSIDRELVCGAASECVRDGVQGSCVQPGHCAFDDGSCGSGLRWDSTARDAFAEQCVEAEDITTLNVCGGMTVLSGDKGDPCGLCNSGTASCDGTDAFQCDGEASLEMSVTTQGSVSASAEFDSNYRAIKAVDLDESTSWFSAGPEGTPTEYIWTGTQNECFTHIKIVGNGGNSNSSFRTEFGFGEATVQVLDDGDEVVYSQSVDLSGTPDPTIDLDPDVLGRKVKLLLSGHESNDCGGFGELYITATR